MKAFTDPKSIVVLSGASDYSTDVGVKSALFDRDAADRIVRELINIDNSLSYRTDIAREDHNPAQVDNLLITQAHIRKLLEVFQ